MDIDLFGCSVPCKRMDKPCSSHVNEGNLSKNFFSQKNKQTVFFYEAFDADDSVLWHRFVMS